MQCDILCVFIFLCYLQDRVITSSPFTVRIFVSGFSLNNCSGLVSYDEAQCNLRENCFYPSMHRLFWHSLPLFLLWISCRWVFSGLTLISSSQSYFYSLTLNLFSLLLLAVISLWSAATSIPFNPYSYLVKLIHSTSHYNPNFKYSDITPGVIYITLFMYMTTKNIWDLK